MCRRRDPCTLNMGVSLTLFYTPVVSETSITSADGDDVQIVTDPCLSSNPWLDEFLSVDLLSETGWPNVVFRRGIKMAGMQSPHTLTSRSNKDPDPFSFNLLIRCLPRASISLNLHRPRTRCMIKKLAISPVTE